MRFTCQQSAFASAIQNVARAIHPKAIIPILRCVNLLARTPGSVEVVATDLQTMVVTTIEAEVEEEGAVAVPCTLLRAYMKTLDAGILTCFDAPSDLSLALSVEQDGALAVFKGFDSDEFPALPACSAGAPLFAVQGEHLVIALQRAVTCAGKAAYRQDGWDPTEHVLLTVDPTHHRLSCVGTDRHLLSYAHIAFTDMCDPPAPALRGLLAADAALKLGALLPPGPCTVQWDGDRLSVQAGATTCYVRFSRNVDVAQYPDYDGLLTAVPELAVRVERPALLAALKHCAFAVLAQGANETNANVHVSAHTLSLRTRAGENTLAAHTLAATPLQGCGASEEVTVELPWRSLVRLVEVAPGGPLLTLAVCVRQQTLALLSDSGESGVLSILENVVAATRPHMGSEPQAAATRAAIPSSVGSRAQVTFGSEQDRATYAPRRIRSAWAGDGNLWEGV